MEEAPQAWHLGLLTPEQRDAALREIETRLGSLPPGWGGLGGGE